MKISFEGMGQWCATFACGSVSEGQTVKISGNGTVAACGDGDNFCGVVTAVGHDGDACSVQLGGMVTVNYTGTTAPAVGFAGLAGNGTGGVKALAGGRSYCVVDVNTTDKTVTFVL